MLDIDYFVNVAGTFLLIEQSTFYSIEETARVLLL